MDPAPGTPREEGYRMPAEWEAHDACWMFWPCGPGVFNPGLDGKDGLAAAREAYAEVARAIARFEPVKMVATERDAAGAMEAVAGADVEVLEFPIDDSWARDTGPTFVLSPGGGLAGVHWRFNNYGNEPHGEKPAKPESAYANDREIGGRILDHLGLRRFEAPLVMEGGAFHVDGQGTVLVTEQCLLNPNRNPDLSREEIERYLLDYLGASKVVWLGRGLEDDETDGHVDELACFASPGVVLAHAQDDESDPDHAVSRDLLTRLDAATDAEGRDFQVLALPAGPVMRHRGVRLSLSYVNFYIANGGIVMPAFGDEARDARAAEVMAEAFPGREIVQVPALDIFVGGGGIHCITQQQPRTG